MLNCGHALVRQLIGDSLRHLAEEFRVDGFCFVNAETLTQGAVRSLQGTAENRVSGILQSCCGF